MIRPRLDVADFDRIRQLRLTRLVQIRDMPSAIADRAFMQVVYGTHPYAHMALGTEESLRQLSIDTVKMFHSRLYRASNATLIASGDIGADEFRRDGGGHVRDVDWTALPRFQRTPRSPRRRRRRSIGWSSSTNRARRKARFASAKSACRATRPTIIRSSC